MNRQLHIDNLKTTRDDAMERALCALRTRMEMGNLRRDAPDVLIQPRIDESARGWSSARAVISGSGAAAARDAATKLNASIRVMIGFEMEMQRCAHDGKDGCDGHTRKGGAFA